MPPQRDTFKDVYIVTELMDADLHHIIKTQELTEEHYQVFYTLKDIRCLHASYLTR